MTALTDIDFYPVVEPILEILDAVLWPAIAVVVAVGTIYCIALGVKVSKADEQNSREKAKKDLIGAIIGFVIIFVLILALKIAVPILENWVRSQMKGEKDMLLGDLVEALKDMFFTFLYRTFSLVCMLIDFLKDIFYMLCGIDPITISGKQGDLLSSLVESDAIRRSFLMVFVIGSILIVVFTVIAVLKSGYNEKMNVFSVLKRSGQSFLTALLVSFVVLAGILLTNTVMRSINIAMTPYGTSGSSTIGGEFLTTIGFGPYIGSESRDAVFSKFVSGELDYTDVNLVKSYFNI